MSGIAVSVGQSPSCLRGRESSMLNGAEESGIVIASGSYDLHSSTDMDTHRHEECMER